jgi:cytidine deaminase
MKIIPFKKPSKEDQNLINEAEKIIQNAYDSYSQFYVSCAILTSKIS